MLEITISKDIAALRESFDVECKLAVGRDGRGGLPKDFWETYSAFANSYGGEVFLGVKEEKGYKFEPVGIANPQKVLDELWTGLNNPQKVSANLLTHETVREVNLEGKKIIHIHVPRSPRKNRPVFIRGNPLTGTYKRLNSSDCLCGEETVRRMLAEQVEDSRDNEILQGYGLEDLDSDSFNAYRQLYASRSPHHPWNQEDPQRFLQNIGAWRVDRETGRRGLTRAGLLMFGRLPPIQEAFPNYMLDYQERSEARAEARWIDRLTLDGSWSGNLFDFYRKVIMKLTAELKVPFVLKGGQRQDDTPIHQALREALVNTLVHADFSGRASVLVVKRPDMFGFRNPGLMRVPQEIAIQGGESDCRNRLIHQMFRYIGLGEQAGSGIPKIFQGWHSQHWRAPLLKEKEQPSEQTLLELRMLDLLPEKVVSDLREKIGEDFNRLKVTERLILATAATEQMVNHHRMTEISTEHAHDLTQSFQRLVRAGWLKSNGHGRGTVYYLTWRSLPTTDQAFEESSMDDLGSEHLDPSSKHLSSSSKHLGPSSKHLDTRSEYSRREPEGWLTVQGVSKPLIDDLEALDPEIGRELIIEAHEARGKKKIPMEEMESTILALCNGHYLTVQVLSGLVRRTPQALRQRYLKPLLDQGKLSLAFPTTPTHPQQAYTSTEGREP